MKKLTYSIFTVITLALLSMSCSGDSYEKRLKKETKAIKNFLSDNGIEVITEYPKDHVFEENQYFLEGKTGVYLRVDKAGDVEGALEKDERQKVYVRFDSLTYLVSNVKSAGNNVQGGAPMSFTYGNATTYLDSYNTSSIAYSHMSPACVLPLEKGVGSGAEVSMIIPFRNGSTNQRNSIHQPIFYSKMIYDYKRHVDPEKNTEEPEE